MKYLIFSIFFYPEINGVSQSVYQRCRYLLAMGNQVKLVIPAYKQNNIPSEQQDLQDMGVDIITVPIGRLTDTDKSPMPDSNCNLYIDSLIHEWQPEVFILDEPMLLFMESGFMLSKLKMLPCNCTTVSIAHGNLEQLYRLIGMDQQGDIVHHHIEKVFSEYDLVVLPSRYLLKNYPTGSKSQFIPFLGVDKQLFTPKLHAINPNKRMQIVYVGRISREKNITLLHEAVLKLINKKLDIKCVFIGEGPMLKTMRQFNTENIQFIGTRQGTDLIDILHDSDVFFTGCEMEAFGITVAEAMACGLAVVTPDDGGNAEQYQHGISGLNFKVSEPSTLVLILEQLYNAPEYRNQLGKEAARHPHSWSEATTLLEQVIQSFRIEYTQ